MERQRGRRHWLQAWTCSASLAVLQKAGKLPLWDQTPPSHEHKGMLARAILQVPDFKPGEGFLNVAFGLFPSQ